jgi:phosphoribosylglycinamide formyltransferase-1
VATPPLRIAILFSGGGTTLQNLIDATRDGRLPAVEIVKAISSRRDAHGVERCRRAGVPCVVVPKSRYPDPAEHSRAVFAHLDPAEIDLVCLAGWMNRLVLEEPWLSNRVMNIHPSLLPDFGGPGMYGRRVHEAVFAAGAAESGCTVHYVTNSIDDGPVLARSVVDIRSAGSAEEIEAAVQAAERELYPRAIEMHRKHVRLQPPLSR